MLSFDFSDDGQRKGKDRTMTELAGHADGSLVRRHDSLCDRQTHSRAPHKIPLILPAVKLVKDHSLLEIVDARTAVRHTDRHIVTGKLGGDGDKGLFP